MRSLPSTRPRPNPCTFHAFYRLIVAALLVAGVFVSSLCAAEPTPSQNTSPTPLPRNLPLPGNAPALPSPSVAKRAANAKTVKSKASSAAVTAPSASPSPTVDPQATPPPLATATPPPSPSVASLPSASPEPSPTATTGDEDVSVRSLSPILPSQESAMPRFSAVRHAQLRVDVPAPIPVALASEEGEGTLVSFPAAIRQINGFGVVYQAPAPNARADFYVLWPGAGNGTGGQAPGGNAPTGSDDGEDDGTSRHFLVMGLRKGARKVLSVVLQGQPRPYTIVLIQADDNNAALSVQFEFPEVPTGAIPLSSLSAGDEATASVASSASPSLFPAGWDGTRVPMSAARLDGFLTKVKGYPTFSKLKPEVYQGIEVVDTETTAVADQWPGGLQVKIVRVMRDHRLDALGFEARLINLSHKEFTYDPEALGVRVEASAIDARGLAASARPTDELYRARLTEAGGRVVAGGVATVFFVVAGTQEGSANNLSPRNRFRLVLEAPAVEARPAVVAARTVDHSKD